LNCEIGEREVVHNYFPAGLHLSQTIIPSFRILKRMSFWISFPD
jgi:hypothetical protein